MSLRRKLQNRAGFASSLEGFSSKSLGSYSIPKMSMANNGVPVKSVTFNKSLLTPMDLHVDPTMQAVRTQEKNQIKDLNDRFVSFIDKVQKLEQQNKMLETKWKLLHQESANHSDVESILKTHIAQLERQLEGLSKDKKVLDTECNAMRGKVHEYKTMYEEEVKKRNEAESSLVSVKKKVDAAHLINVELHEKMVIISDEIRFCEAVHDAEMRELQENQKETSVIVELDNSRALNMDQIISDARDQYEEIASRSRKETEDWHNTKLNQLNTEADRCNNELHTINGEIAKLKQMISRKQQEIHALNTQQKNIEKDILEVDRKGEQAVQDAHQRIKDLEQALQKAKKDMALQVKQYQEVMNLKLALDIEIATYKKLLEGEEARHGQDYVPKVHAAPIQCALMDAVLSQQKKLKPVLIKTVETHHWTSNHIKDSV